MKSKIVLLLGAFVGTVATCGAADMGLGQRSNVAGLGGRITGVDARKDPAMMAVAQGSKATAEDFGKGGARLGTLRDQPARLSPAGEAWLAKNSNPLGDLGLLAQYGIYTGTFSEKVNRFLILLNPLTATSGVGPKKNRIVEAVRVLLKRTDITLDHNDQQLQILNQSLSNRYKDNPIADKMQLFLGELKDKLGEHVYPGALDKCLHMGWLYDCEDKESLIHKLSDVLRIESIPQKMRSKWQFDNPYLSPFAINGEKGTSLSAVARRSRFVYIVPHDQVDAYYRSMLRCENLAHKVLQWLGVLVLPQYDRKQELHLSGEVHEGEVWWDMLSHCIQQFENNRQQYNKTIELIKPTTTAAVPAVPIPAAAPSAESPANPIAELHRQRYLASLAKTGGASSEDATSAEDAPIDCLEPSPDLRCPSQQKIIREYLRQFNALIKGHILRNMVLQYGDRICSLEAIRAFNNLPINPALSLAFPKKGDGPFRGGGYDFNYLLTCFTLSQEAETVKARRLIERVFRHKVFPGVDFTLLENPAGIDSWERPFTQEQAKVQSYYDWLKRGQRNAYQNVRQNSNLFLTFTPEDEVVLMPERTTIFNLAPELRARFEQNVARQEYTSHYDPLPNRSYEYGGGDSGW